MALAFRLFGPDAASIEAIRCAAEDQPLSYDGVGGTRGSLPDGWAHDDDSVSLGRGSATFELASRAVAEWRMFDLPWVRMPRREPPVEGATVGFATRQLGGWSIHTCRVVYVVDERSGPIWRSGFAYGTLATHAVAGEELFHVTWDRATDEVRFGIRKFSRLRHPLVRLGAPVARHLQRRFSVQALAAVRDHLAAQSTPISGTQ